MARPKKIGLDYFPLDTVFDKKMQAIEMLYGNDGFVWVIKFWQEAYQTADGEVDVRGLFGEILAKNSRITTELQDSIIKACVEVGLLQLTESGKLTSDGIKKRISKVSGERASALSRRGYPVGGGVEKEEAPTPQEENTNTKDKVKETPHCSANNSRTMPEIEMPSTNTTDGRPSNVPVIPVVPPPSDAGQKEPYTKDFVRFWESYPKKEAKGDAFNAWKVVTKIADKEKIISAAAAFADMCVKTNKERQYIKHPGTWLRAHCWNDESVTQQPKKRISF